MSNANASTASRDFTPVKPFVVIFGNVKGGTGKSTLAFHGLITLLYQGHRVGSVDLDGRQGTFSRYLENRQAYATHAKKVFPLPSSHLRLSPVWQENMEPFQNQLDAHIAQSTDDILIIDTPGNDSALAQYAHSLADLLITPINDSYVDLDLLINIDDSIKEQGRLPLSTYANMVWEQRMQKAKRQEGAMEWVIIRNRMHNLVSKNRLQIDGLLANLAKRIGFHMVNGVGERVIFRELFGQGMTLLDKEERRTTLSHIAARQELRFVMELITRFYQQFLGRNGRHTSSAPTTSSARAS